MLELSFKFVSYVFLEIKGFFTNVSTYIKRKKEIPTSNSLQNTEDKTDFQMPGVARGISSSH